MWRSITACALGACALAACGGQICDPAALTSALASASPGDRVELGACTVNGSFTVPAGVTLAGGGPSSVIASDDVAVTLAGENAEVTNLDVRANGQVGVRAGGHSTVTISHVRIAATRGVAILATSAALVLDDVIASGEISDANASDPRYLRVLGGPIAAASCPSGTTCECTPGDVMPDGTQACDASGHWATITAVAGLVASGCDVTATLFSALGFASYGAVVQGGAGSSFDGGSIDGNLGVGVFITTTQVSLLGVTVSHTFQGLRGTPAYGIVATDGGVHTDGAHVTDNDRYGIVQVGADGGHTGLVATGNGDAALWVGSSAAFTLGGDSMIADNDFAGVVVVDSSHVTIDGAAMMNTHASTRALGTFGSARVGDGLHLVGSMDSVTVRNVTLGGNERAGLLVDLGPTSAVVPMFDHVNVSSDGASLGAVAGHGSAGAHQITSVGTGGWDTGITRTGAALANDAATGAALDVAGVAAPGVVPSMDAVHAVVPMF